MKTKVIGRSTTYHGTEHPYLKGCKVRIVKVFKNAARPDYDADKDDNYIWDDVTLTRVGGVSADDRVEVQPWLEKEGRLAS